MADKRFKKGKNNKPDKSNKNNKSDGQIVLPRKLTRKATAKTAAGNYEKGQVIRNTGSDKTYQSIKKLKSDNKVVSAIRKLTDDEALTSYALFSMVQIADSGISFVAYHNGTSEVSPDGTEAVKVILSKIDTLSDYSKGYSDKPSLHSVIHTMLLEGPQTGGVSAELVLDDTYMPHKIQVVNYASIEWISDGEGGRKPQQIVQGGQPVSLDLPTFFVSEMHKETHEAYATSMLKSSLDATVANIEFIEDMRRTVNRAGHSRLVVSLNAEKVRNSAPADIRADEKKLADYMQNTLDSVREELQELTPEDSVVSYDSADFDVADIGGSKTDYVPLLRQMANYQATSLKTPTSVIGIRSEGSQSLSNSETLVYLKVVRAIQTPVEEVLSRVFTLAARLYGFDVYVRVNFNSIDLRPESELEAYKVQKQSRHLELLSLGIISDYAFCIRMGIDFNPAMPKLSGTGFYQSSNKSADPNTDNRGGMESTLNADTPKKAGGKSQ